MRRLLLTVLVAAAACGPAAADQTANAHLMKVDQMAAGTLDALPTGAQFVRVELFQMPPGTTFSSKKHQVGIIYQLAGTQTLQYASGAPQVLTPGTALFLQSVTHSHQNTGTTQNAWYNFALWPSSQRALPLKAYATIPFETPDIPAADLPPGAYGLALRRVTLQAGGRSPSHQYGGLEVILVIDGSLTVKVRGQSAAHLDADQGVYILPNTISQESAAGGPATYLAYFLTQQGKPFETLVSSSP